MTISSRADSFFPDAVGSTWEYSQTGAQPSQFFVRIAGRDTTDDRDLLKFETKTGPELIQQRLISTTTNGIFLHERNAAGEEAVEFDPPRTLLPRPLQVGTEWTLDDDVGGLLMHQNFKVIAEETVLVPAGEFRAYHMHCEQPWPISISVDRWFAPGTGFVKDVTTTRGPGGRLLGRVTTVLTKFSETPPPPEPAPTPSGTPGITLEVAAERDGPSVTTFRTDAPNIYVRWRGEHLVPHSTVRVAWVVEDVGEVADPDFVVDETETEVTTPEFGARFVLSRPSDGWAPGKYRLELYLDDVLLEKVPVSINE